MKPLSVATIVISMYTPPMSSSEAQDKAVDSSPVPEESTDKRVWRNVIGLVGGSTLGEILQGLVTAQAVRILGPADFGKFSQAMAVVGVSDGVSAFGLNQLGPVLSVDYKDRMGEFLGTVLCLRFFIAMVVLIGVWLLSPYIQSTESWILRLAALAILASPLAQTATIPFFLNQDNWRVAWLPGARSLVNMSLLALVLWFAPHVEWVVACVLAARAFYAFAMSEVARRRYRFRYGFDANILRRVLRIAPKAAWLDSVVILYVRASYFVLDSLGASVVGIYALADSIAQPILRVSGAFASSSLPIVAEFAKQNKFRELWSYFFRNAVKILGTLGVIAVLLWLIVDPIFHTFFPEYLQSIPVLWVLYIGVCFMSVNQMTSTCLNGMGYFGVVAVVATINLCVYAFGAWLWVETYGALGAALATTVMEGCNMLMQLSLLIVIGRRRTREQPVS
jgi:O-antigen/teichoic acid export membrane protein